MGTIKVLWRSISKFLHNYPCNLHPPFLNHTHLPSPPPPLPVISSSAVVQRPAHYALHSCWIPRLFGSLLIASPQDLRDHHLVCPHTPFLLFGKSLALHFLAQSKPSTSLLVLMYMAIIRTNVCGSTAILSANATAFFILFLAFDCQYSILLSFLGPIVYSTILGYTIMVCNLVLTMSGVLKYGGCIAILKSCFLTEALFQYRVVATLSLAGPRNLLLATTEALFQYRVVATYQRNGRFGLAMVSEECFIAYWYSVFIVLHTVVSHTFLKSCRVDKEDDDKCQDDDDETRLPF